MEEKTKIQQELERERMNSKILAERVRELEMLRDMESEQSKPIEKAEVPYKLPDNCLPPDAKPYICGQCDSAFSHCSSLARHYKRYHEEAYMRKEYEDRTPSLKQQCTACLAIFSFGKDCLARHNKICRKKTLGEGDETFKAKRMKAGVDNRQGHCQHCDKNQARLLRHHKTCKSNQDNQKTCHIAKYTKKTYKKLNITMQNVKLMRKKL